MSPSPHPFVCTTLSRADAEGCTGDCDVVVHFSVASRVRGCPATRDDAGCADEFEFAMEGAEFDGGEPDDCPGPLTDDELRTLLAWLVSGEGYQAAATKVAEGEANYDARVAA